MYLDVGHDDYFRAGIPGCLDLATSGWLVPASPSLVVVALCRKRSRARWSAFEHASINPAISAVETDNTPGGASGCS
jgi:hypothetical protein